MRVVSESVRRLMFEGPTIHSVLRDAVAYLVVEDEEAIDNVVISLHTRREEQDKKLFIEFREVEPRIYPGS